VSVKYVVKRVVLGLQHGYMSADGMSAGVAYFGGNNHLCGCVRDALCVCVEV
jgi:hypothetical protein